MNQPCPLRALLVLALAPLLLTACATSSPALRAWEGVEQDEATACEDADADQCVVLACEEGECGVFAWEDVDPEALASAFLAPGVELARGFSLLEAAGS